MSEAKLYYVSETGLVEGEALGRLRVYLASDYDALKEERDQLRAELAAIRASEPFAWAEFDGEGGYYLRLYEYNETFHDEYIKRNGEKYRDWVQPLYTDQQPQPEESEHAAIRRRNAEVVAIESGQPQPDVQELVEALEACLDYGSMTGAEWVDDKARAALATYKGQTK